jgi:hypothetical protein
MVRGREIPFLQGADGEGEFDAIIASQDERGTSPLDPDEVQRRLRRAAACVNALAGIDDPEVFMRLLRNVASDRDVVFNGSMDAIRAWSALCSMLPEER